MLLLRRLGDKLLTDRDPDNAEYDERDGVDTSLRRMVGRPMLVPVVGEGLENWTVPQGGRCSGRRRPRTADDPEFIEDENGEMLRVVGSSRRRRMGTFTPVAPRSLRIVQLTSVSVR